MPTVHVAQASTAPAERVLEAARDFSARRADMWPDVYVEHLKVHDRGDTWADVTEGNPWPRPIGFVWERLRYDWSQPEVVKGIVTDSNLFQPGSSWEIRATPQNDGGSLVEITGVRHLRGWRGALLFPVFPLGLARRTVVDHLGHFVSYVETSTAKSNQPE